MTSIASNIIAERTPISGQCPPRMCSLSASPAPRPSQKRPGNMAPSVAAAWAITAGWYRKPGLVTPVPNRRLVRVPSAPMNAQANAAWPCCDVHGWMCSETMKPAEKPALSAATHHSSRSVGWNCSSIAA
jgi:hypothetical protein